MDARLLSIEAEIESKERATLFCRMTSNTTVSSVVLGVVDDSPRYVTEERH